MPTNRFSASSGLNQRALQHQTGFVPGPIWGIDPAKPGSDCTVSAEWTAAGWVELPAEPAAIVPVPDTSRIWDMLVLAARSSRYGD